MPSLPARLRDGTPTQRTMALAAAVVLLFTVLPAESRQAAALGVAAGAAIIALVGLHRRTLPRRHRWVPVVLALVVWAAADVGPRATALITDHTLTWPAGWNLLYPVGTLLLAVGIAGVLRSNDVTEPQATTDAVIATLSVGILLAVTVTDPRRATFAAGWIGGVQVAVTALANLVLLGVLLRGLLTGGHTRAAERAGRTLLAGGGLVVGAVVVLALALRTGSSDPLSLFTPVWLAACLLLSGAVHEAAGGPATGMTDAAGAGPGTDRRRSPLRRSTARRVLVLSLTLPMFALLLTQLETTPIDLLVAAGSGVLFLLAVLRVRQLLRELSLLRREEFASHLADQESRLARRFEALVQHTSDVLVVIDADGRVTYATPSAAGLLGDDPVGFSADQLAELIHPDERRATIGTLRSRIGESRGRPVTISARLGDRGEGARYVQIVAADLRHDPDVAGVVFTLQETTHRIELERELRFLAFHDPLTGLCNRQLFENRVDHALDRARRGSDRLAVLVCDIDDFKDINDSEGHRAGDEVLRILAERLERETRASDTVARLGSDEFAVLVESLDETRSAIELAERLLDAIGEPFEVAGRQLKVTGSFGVAVDAGERSGQELLRDADIAAHAAKTEGAGRWSLHRTTMTAETQDRLTLASDLNAAIVAGTLDVAYQPIVEVQTCAIVGFEALARWTHPVRGPIPPDRFIPMAERSGAIIGLGRLVLSRSLANLCRWLEQAEHADLHITVNVSTRQLHDPAFATTVMQLLEHHGIAPEQLVLELTESVLIRDEAVMRSIGQVRERGVRLAVDDFGTGYSSLGYLRELPIDLLKIDRSFISALEIDPSADELVRTIVDLGRRLGLEVVAEGVETHFQHEALKAMGCPYAQGYLFDRPRPRAEVPGLIHDGLALANAPARIRTA